MQDNIFLAFCRSIVVIFLIMPFYIAMMLIVAASNYLVQFPLNDWLSWGSFTYPLSFLVNELCNRFYGCGVARKVVVTGFILGVVLSFALATPKIAMASGTAFLVSQLMDISLFSRLRQQSWWVAPFVSGLIASLIDTAIFWTLAFWGEPLPVLTWAMGDFSVKLAMDLLMLTPFRWVSRRWIPVENQ